MESVTTFNEFDFDKIDNNRHVYTNKDFELTKGEGENKIYINAYVCINAFETSTYKEYYEIDVLITNVFNHEDEPIEYNEQELEKEIINHLKN